MNEFPIMDPDQGITLFRPYISPHALKELEHTLSTRWIGQGPKVDQFERAFKARFLGGFEPLAVGSGTDALHLAYLLCGITSGDEVIVPVFTCTATNIPLRYIGAVPIFCDVDTSTMNLALDDIEHRITDRTKAIVCVDYGGVPCNYTRLREICDKHGLKLIADAAHSVGSQWRGTPVGQLADLTVFSFQAIKTITTGDGGLLSIRDPSLAPIARRLRWFGIDREAKQGGIWENDIKEIGYKYQLTDLGASLGLRSLAEFEYIEERRRALFEAYEANLTGGPAKLLGSTGDTDYHLVPWLATVIVESDRIGLMKALRERGIESAQVHYRNDRYSIFGGRRDDLPNMDLIEDKYLVLPLHLNMSVEDVLKITNVIRSGW